MTKLSASLICCAIMILLALATPAQAGTTYYYTGAPWGGFNVAFVLDLSGFPPRIIPNPNAAYDVASFGTNITGSLTFNIDTTGLSATFPLQQFPDLATGSFSAGSDFAPFGGFLSNDHITFTNGEITDWQLSAISASCAFSAGPSTCRWAISTNGDSIAQFCVQCIPMSASAGPGTWSLTAPAAAPSTVLGGGLPGLLLLLGGLLRWSRRK